jgi:hypothetical protein
LGEFFNHPAVQGGVAPFASGLVVALLLHRLRLGGLALVAAFFTAVYFVAGFGFTPLTTTRKIFLVCMAAPLLGILLDLEVRPTSFAAAFASVLAAGAAAWVFWPLITQKPLAEACLTGGSAAFALAFLAWFSRAKLSTDGVRAGAAALGLGLGTGSAAILAGPASYGLYGIALGAGAGAFLFVQMMTGKKAFAGATFTVSAAVLGGLVAAGSMFLAKLPWYALLALALVPIGASLPAPSRPVWLQAILLSLYAFAIAAGACFLAWHAA